MEICVVWIYIQLLCHQWRYKSVRILILTFGSTGDVLPYVALGKGLMDRGHFVVICTNSRFEEFVKQNGLSYSYMSDEITQLIESAMGRNILEGLTNFVGFCKAIFKLVGKLGPLQAGILKDTWAAAKQHRPDIILFSPKNYMAVHFAEKLGCRAIAAPLFPQYVPTAEFPTLGFPKFINSPWYNKLTYRVARSMSSLIGGKYIRLWRKANKLPPSFCGIDICHDTSGNAIPVINGYSTSLVPVPDDCPKSVYTCGFWFLQQAQHWTPPEDLVNFLADGPAPVYIGFGSMASNNSKKVTKIIISAIEKCACRAIVATGWGGLETDLLPDTIFKIKSVPHDWLFPRVTAVVHHGGAGTTAAGLKAGCPTLICPIFGDQPLWGSVVYNLGAGVAPIPQKKLDVERLSSAIEELLSNPSIKQRALELSNRINKENGIAAAIAVIESESIIKKCENA